MESGFDLKHKIHYFAREKYYQTVESLALNGLKTYPNDVSFKFYRNIALVLCGRYQDSIPEFECMINHKDVNVAAILALIEAHKFLQLSDKDSAIRLNLKLKVEIKTASELALYYGALFLFFSGKIEKSKEYLERLLKLNNVSLEALTLKGWIEISLTKSGKYEKALDCFNAVLDTNIKNLDALLGQVKVKELNSDFDGAISLLNQIIVRNPDSLPPLIEKMKMQLACSDWDFTIETATRILAIDTNCLEALRMKCLVLLVRDGNYNEAANCIRRYFTEAERVEEKNGRLFLTNAQLFSYVSGKNPIILGETLKLAEKAAHLDPSNPDFISELGYQNLLQRKLKESEKFFKAITKLDDSSVTALIGLMWCQIHEGNLNEEVNQQVVFLREILKDQPTSELLLMSAKLCHAPSSAIDFLNQATDIHFGNIEKFPYGVDYLYALNPVFSMDLVYEYLKYVPSSLIISKSSDIMLESLKRCFMILEKLTEACPGLIEAQYEYAHVQFLAGNINEAKATIRHILDDLDATSAEAHILMAQILLLEQNYQQGAQTLEVGLSYNFKIREHPLYHLMHAMVHKESGNLAECITSLKSAMMACDLGSTAGFAKEKQFGFDLSLSDKVTLYLELSNAYHLLNQRDELTKLMEEAMEKFHGTAEEGRLLIANAELSVCDGNVNDAIETLEKIHIGESHFALSKKALANLYLTYKKDREAFIKCYRDIVQNDPCAETYVALADALMSIQEPDLAIEAFEEALKYRSKDINLICKMGKALVQTHHFAKAINYYKQTIKSEKNLELVNDMAELYFKLGQLDNAERVLVAEVENTKMIDADDMQQIFWRTKLLRLLAKVRDKSGNLTESLAALKAAKESHNRIEKRVFNQSLEHKETLSDICSEMAILMTRLRDFNGAIKCYMEALTVKPSDTQILVSLCRLYMQVNQVEECQVMCQRLLTTDPENESATVMLADVAFRKIDFEAAIHHFKQLLSNRPMSWTALARLIEVMRRTGTLEEARAYLERCETLMPQSKEVASYSYCKGLFEWYSGRPTLAIRHFNRARFDPLWGQQALRNMIEICLNPCCGTLGSEPFSEEADDNTQDSKEVALKTAQRLLVELKRHQTAEGNTNLRLLENFWLLATKERQNIEKALQDFMNIANKDLYRDHVGVALGIAMAYVLQKQVQKARNQLKRVAKNPWNFEDAEYLEQVWLLLADIYIQSGKMELPIELIQRILQHNKSCSKAYEYAGFIAEREQLYKDAALQYENAWKYEGQTNPAIAYKLAFNYLKGRKYAEAIDICNLVLRMYPNYPRIQKDILEKARNNLRT